MIAKRHRNNFPRLLIQYLPGNLGGVCYLLLAVMPVLSVILRLLNIGELPSTDKLVFHLLTILAAMSGMYTEKFNEHLCVDLGLDLQRSKLAITIINIRNLTGTFILIQFFLGSLEMLLLAFGNEKILGIPLQVFVVAIPFGFLGILSYWLKRVSKDSHWWLHILAILLGTVFNLPSVLNILYDILPNTPEFIFSIEALWYSIIPVILPFLIVLLILLIPTGMPLYIALGGIGMLLFLREGYGSSSIIYEGYTVMSNAAVPAITLFTLTGLVLSESQASKRFVEVFISLFGWVPGGIVIATVLVSCIFTTFTGASGVTILALGALLHHVLQSSQYSEKFSLGLITSSGSIGLFFPPSLAIILYGSVAGINILHIFLAAIIPGTLLILIWCIFGVGISIHAHNTVSSFSPARAKKAIKEAFWELLIPIITLFTYFSGLATLLEASAISLLYTIVVECLIKKEFNLQELKEVFLKSMRIIGGIFIIMMLAKGLAAYIVDAGIPQTFATFVQENISSRFLFLILLNIALILTGMLMDIYSAILVVVPLILPLGNAFGIHPLHLAMIFLINLELGFMTPPVGLNLFFSSYRFKKSLSQIYKSIVPFLVLLLLTVVLITFIPGLSLLLVPK